MESQQCTPDLVVIVSTLNDLLDSIQYHRGGQIRLLVLLQTKSILDVQNPTCQIHGGKHAAAVQRLLLKHALHHHTLIILHLFLELCNKSCVVLTNDSILQDRAPIDILHAKLTADLLLRQITNRVALNLNLHRVDSIFAIVELDDIVVCITNGSVMLDREILHGLNELTLNITCIGCLYSGINQTLTTRHGVKEELLRSQTTNEGGLNESTSLRTIIVFLVMRQGTIRKSIRNTLTLNRRLSQTRHHLSYVQGLTL